PRVPLAPAQEDAPAADGEPVAAAVRTRAGARPVVVHPAWRTGLEEAVAVALASSGPARTPEPLRAARRLARVARAADEGRLGHGTGR
ncbi:MAG TPA: endonuclease V, partial [Actinomycetota bacterium]|nr:endonuclease V [Actinomycetota bacterium]